MIYFRTKPLARHSAALIVFLGVTLTITIELALPFGIAFSTRSGELVLQGR